MLEVKNNFLDNQNYWTIYSAVYSENIPWFKKGNLFTHLLIEEGVINSSQVDLVQPFTKIIDNPIQYSSLFLIPKTGKENALVKNLKEKTLIYCLDSSESYSIVSSIQKIETKQNQAIIIDYPTSIIQKRQSDKDYICMLYISFKNK